MASVSIIYRKEKINKNGKAPVHLRIIKNRNINYIATGIMVAKEQWDEKNKKVKSSVKNSGRINAFIAKKFAEAQNTVLNYETNSRSLTSRNLRDKIFGKKPTSFFDFADIVVAAYEKEGKIGTYHKNQSIITKLKDYPPAERLTFHDITPEFLLKYEAYLRKEHKNKTNTVHKDLKFIRKVFNDAIRQDIIEYEITPFRKYKLRTEKTQRHHLSEEEILKIENCQFPAASRLDLHRDMFIFASYVGGLRVSDVLKIQWKDFDGCHLNVVIKKTGNQVSIKVPNKALEIISKYRNQKATRDSFLFPMLPAKLNINDPSTLDKAISNATAQINANLKSIASKAGIEKNCSFHISRHSFAVRALRKGISIDKLSKLMAHSAIRETQIYAKIVNEELDKAMDSFN